MDGGRGGVIKFNLIKCEILSGWLRRGNGRMVEHHIVKKIGGIIPCILC